MSKQPPKIPAKAAKKHYEARHPKIQSRAVANKVPNDVFASGVTLFCKFCQQIVYFKRLGSCKDHLQSKAHVKNKEKHRASVFQ